MGETRGVCQEGERGGRSASSHMHRVLSPIFKPVLPPGSPTDLR